MTTRKPREYTFTAAVEKLRALGAASDAELDREHDKTRARVTEKYRAKFAAVFARVPETIRGAVEQAAGVSAPEGGA